MRGEMAESEAGESRWIDVDKGTFVRFAQFAYTGDYSTSKGFIAQVVVEAESSWPPQEPRLLDEEYPSAWQHPQPNPFAPRSSVPPLPAPPPSARSSFPSPPPALPPSAQEPDDEWLFEVPSKKGKKSKNSPLSSYRSGPTSVSDMFNSLKYPLIESRSNLCTCKSSMNDGPMEHAPPRRVKGSRSHRSCAVCILGWLDSRFRN